MVSMSRVDSCFEPHTLILTKALLPDIDKQSAHSLANPIFKERKFPGPRFDSDPKRGGRNTQRTYRPIE